MKVIIKESDIRLDQYIYEKFPQLFPSRSLVSKYIKDKIILINDKPVKPSYKIKINDTLYIPDKLPRENNVLKATPMDLNIVYEDKDILIINKKAGQIVHPGISHKDDTIVNALIERYGNKLPTIGGRERPGIVHRLDKDTSGLLIVALTEKAYYKLIEMQREKLIKKIYWGIVFGEIKEDSGRIEYPIGRSISNRKLFSVNGINPKPSITEFEIIKRKCGYSLMRFHLITGRTHQIRVHMKSIGHPIVGDLQYTKRGRKIDFCGNIKELTSHMLCAKKLELKHPVSGKELKFEIPLPQDFFMK